MIAIITRIRLWFTHFRICPDCYHQAGNPLSNTVTWTQCQDCLAKEIESIKKLPKYYERKAS